MPKYLICGDIHFSDRPPSACTESYLDDLFVLLEHVRKLGQADDIDGVIWSGDIFHHKQPNRTSHRTMQRAIDLVHKHKKLWLVPGNHDMSNDRFESIYETQPLGILLQSGAELLNGWESTGQHPIYGIPWKQSWDEKTVESAFAGWRLTSKWQTRDCLVVAHAPLYPPSQEMEFEYYPTKKVLGDNRKPWSEIQGEGYCYYGHVHEAHGTYQVGDVTFCNQGAITRGSLHESELNRKVAVTTWEPDKGFIRVDIPHKPADEIFRLMEKYEVEDKQVELNGFLESVGQTKLEITSIEAVTNHIRTMGLEPDVVSAAIELLASSSH